MYTTVSEAMSDTISETAGEGGGPELGVEAARPAQATYQYYMFLPRCETYALRLAGEEITGLYGPLEYDKVLLSALPNFPYESHFECLAWAKGNFSDFVPCDAEDSEDAEFEESRVWI